MNRPDDHWQPEALREALIQVALEAWEQAGISGLCAEGRWEAAISALRVFDLQQWARENAGAVPASKTPGP